MEKDFENKTGEGSLKTERADSLEISKGENSRSSLRLPSLGEGAPNASLSKLESLNELKLETANAWRDFPLKLSFPLHRLNFKKIAPYSSFLELNKRNPHKRIPREVAEQAKACLLYTSDAADE